MNKIEWTCLFKTGKTDFNSGSAISAAPTNADVLSYGNDWTGNSDGTINVIDTANDDNYQCGIYGENAAYSAATSPMNIWTECEEILVVATDSA